MSSAPGGECLLHPELMSSEAIIEVLLARKVKIEGLNSMAREDLINLYNQFCLPHSQRKPRDSARGKASNTPADKAPAADTKPKIYTLPPGLMIDKTGRIVPIIDPNDPNNLTSFTGTVRNFYAIKDPPVANDSKRKRSDDPSNNPPSDKNQRRRIVWPSKENDELTENMSALNFVVNLQTDSIDNA